MQVDLMPVERLVPYARNPRRNDGAVDAVAASIREFGFRVPVVVDEQLTVLAGHTRLKAARKLGLAQVPVHIAAGLSEAQKKAFRIAAEMTGRACHAIELSPQYVDVAVRRWQQFTGQKAMLEATGEAFPG